VEERVCEGRYGTIYRCRQPSSGKQLTLEVLRTAVVGDDEEVRAVNATRCAGIATVSSFGLLPDGRRYRMMEHLDGESLEQVLQKRGPLPPREVAQVLTQVAGVLEVAHAWAIAHGCLGTSNVFLVGGAVKLIDFGLAAKPVRPKQDLRSLGALGFALLSGHELDDAAPLPKGGATPEGLERLLRELVDERVVTATEARKEFEGLKVLPGTSQPQPALPQQVQPEQVQPQLPAPRPPRRSRLVVLVALVGVLAAAAGVAIFIWPGLPRADVPAAPPDEYDVETAEAPPDEPEAEPPVEPVVEASGKPVETTAPRPPPKPPKVVRRVPSAKALSDGIVKLEARLRRQARPGDDLDQALFVLNKQRLRLSGSPSVEDRLEVARQLAGWRRSYLRP
jgi:serine/threonine protein kinase